MTKIKKEIKIENDEMIKNPVNGVTIMCLLATAKISTQDIPVAMINDIRYMNQLLLIKS